MFAVELVSTCREIGQALRCCSRLRLQQLALMPRLGERSFLGANSLGKLREFVSNRAILAAKLPESPGGNGVNLFGPAEGSVGVLEFSTGGIHLR